MKSRLFTDAEMAEIDRQSQGDHTDKTGIYASRVRPKIRELLDVWLPKVADLVRLEERKR